MSSEPRIALVTGANRGIGLEVCRQLASRGVQVILSSRDPAKGAAAVASLQEQGCVVEFLPLDVGDLASIRSIQNEIQERYGRLDILVNNAAVYLDERRNLIDLPLELIEETMEVNFYGALHLCRAFLPGMIARDYGRIVNVTSEAGSLASMGSSMPIYAISKAALNAMTRVLASQVRNSNIKINAICPGWVRSDMGGPNAPRSLLVGAAGVVWAALLPDNGPSGSFYRDQKPLPW